jgi:hypothetical protein
MGAQQFFNRATGKNARDAFVNAVERASDDEGRGGYTGTIAEKHEFVMISVPDGEDATAFARKLLNEDDPRIEDKWGPAGCVKVKEGEFVFFGWASS